MFKNNVILAVVALLILGFSAPVLADADTTAPVVNIALNPASPNGNFPWYITPTDFSFSATDDLDPAPTTYFLMNQDSAFAGTCEELAGGVGEFYGGGSLPVGTEGVNYIHFCAVDVSNNRSSVQTQEIDLDTVAPISSASAPATSANVTFPVQMNATEVTNPALGASLYVRKDGGTWQIDPATLSGTMGSYSFDFTPSGDGTYDFYTIATDDAGNLEVKPETVEATTVVSTAPVGDLNPPVTTLVIDSPDGNNGWYIGQPIVSFSVSDPDSNVANSMTYYCVDTTLTCTPNTSYAGPFQLPNGIHYIQFFSEDESTNTEGVQTAPEPIKVDESAPTNQSVVLDSGAAFNNTGNVSATLNQGNDEPAGIGSDIATCELSTNSGSTWTDVSGQTSFALNSLTNGPVSVLYRCTDDAGNVSVPVSAGITVELPSVTTPSSGSSSGPSGGGGGGTSGGGGFIGNIPPTGQVLGASTISNPELLKFINLLARMLANKGKVLGAMTVKPNNHVQILNFLNSLKLRLATR